MRPPENPEICHEAHERSGEEDSRKIDAQAVPESHPVVPELTGLFGEHTFFVDGLGLNIVEPAPAHDGQEIGRIINLADWSDSSRTRLVPHEPQSRDIDIELAA
jgi:hypothetical protein